MEEAGYDSCLDMLAWPVDPSVGVVAHTADAVVVADVAAVLEERTHTAVVEVEEAEVDAVDAEDVVDIDAVVAVLAFAADVGAAAVADVDKNTYSHSLDDYWSAEECCTRFCTLPPCTRFYTRPTQTYRHRRAYRRMTPKGKRAEMLGYVQYTDEDVKVTVVKS
jgi:hypothetical protein